MHHAQCVFELFVLFTLLAYPLYVAAAATIKEKGIISSKIEELYLFYVKRTVSVTFKILAFSLDFANGCQLLMSQSHIAFFG
jgi:hypothetical protein